MLNKFRQMLQFDVLLNSSCTTLYKKYTIS